MKVLILGRGRVGTGLSKALRRASVAVKLRSTRTATAGDLHGADVVVLAVPDRAIDPCARAIAPRLCAGAAVLHCAGSLPANAAEGACVPAGVMHPLVSFARHGAPPDLRGTTFVISGHRRATSLARAIARACGARALEAPVHGPAYHAAAALVANGAAALATVGVSILVRLGLGQRHAEHAVGHLLRTVAANIDALGVPGALTGPIARGDADTVRAHRAALFHLGRDAARDYDGVAPIIVHAAKAQGLSKQGQRNIRRALAEERSVSRRREPS